MEDIKKEILELLPYSKPFLFVDELTRIDENSSEGNYTFREDEYFYAGHFKDRPVTPGVILTECMAQIGVVSLGIYLTNPSADPSAPLRDLPAHNGNTFVFTESHVIFEKPVFPGEQVHVISRKKYWRLGKLKCIVEMYNAKVERVCFGEMSGMIQKLK